MYEFTGCSFKQTVHTQKQPKKKYKKKSKFMFSRHNMSSSAYHVQEIGKRRGIQLKEKKIQN